MPSSILFAARVNVEVSVEQKEGNIDVADMSVAVA
jgi:hypothetical protein